MCGVKKPGIYVPPVEMEILYCMSGEYRKCPRYIDMNKNDGIIKSRKNEGKGDSGK